MTGNDERPTNRQLLAEFDWYVPIGTAGGVYHTLGAKERRKLRLVAAYYDWHYWKLWSGQCTQKKWRAYIEWVLERFLVLSALAGGENTNLSTTTMEILNYGPETEKEFVEMYYRSSFLPEDERDAIREEYEHTPEDYEDHDPVPRAVRFDRTKSE